MMRRLNAIGVLIIGIVSNLLVCCNLSSAKTDNRSDEYQDEFIDQDKLFPINYTTNDRIEYLISCIDASESVHGHSVGLSGTMTVDRACFEELLEIISDEALVNLVHHSNPVVRTYAAIGIHQKEIVYKDSLHQLLKDDTARVTTFFGCLIMERQVSSFAVWPTTDTIITSTINPTIDSIFSQGNSSFSPK